MESEVSSGSPVSWESAFWGLIAIQIATLTQNSGAVLGLRYHMRIGLRSSPVFCALDTLMVSVKFVRLRFVHRSWKLAAQHVWWDRFSDEDGNATPSSDDAWEFNMLAFFLGAVPQAVKIYSMSGVLKTQATATIFLSSFIMMEMFRLAAGSERPVRRQVQLQEAVRAPIKNSQRIRLARFFSISRIITFLAISGNVAQFWLCLVVFLAVLPQDELWHPPDDISSNFLIVCHRFFHYAMIVMLSICWCRIFKKGTGILDILAANRRQDVELGQVNREEHLLNRDLLGEGDAALENNVRDPPRVHGAMNDNMVAENAQPDNVPQQHLRMNPDPIALNPGDAVIFGIRFPNPFDIYLVPAMFCHLIFVPYFLLYHEGTGNPLAFSFRDTVGLIFMFGIILAPGLLYLLAKQLTRLRLTRRMVAFIGIRGEDAWTEFYGFFVFVVWFAAFFLAYRNMFDSERTWRPSWTERLG